MTKKPNTFLHDARQRAELEISESERCADWERRWHRFSLVLGSMEAKIYFDRDDATGLVSPRVGEIGIADMELKLEQLLGKKLGRRQKPRS